MDIYGGALMEAKRDANSKVKRVLGIIAGILVARHLKTTDDLFDSKSSPRTESLVAAAVHWAERIMRKVDAVCQQ